MRVVTDRFEILPGASQHRAAPRARGFAAMADGEPAGVSVTIPLSASLFAFRLGDSSRLRRTSSS